jgi:hypothetical protein
MKAIGGGREQRLAALLTICLLACAPAHAQEATHDYARNVTDPTKATKDDIARESENPIGNLIVLPFENYTNFGFGPNEGTQNILEFEPVVPFHLRPDWTLITRAIIPAVWNPDLSPAPSVPQAIAPTDSRRFSRPATRSTAGRGASAQLRRSRH